MSNLEYTEGGSKFRLVIDAFDSAVGNEGTSAPESVAQYMKMPDNALLEAENVLLDIPGIARRRGTTKASAVGANDIVTTTSGATLTAFLGTPLASAATAGPYVGTTLPSLGTASTAYLQASAGASVTTGLSSTPVSRCPSLGGKAVILAGRNNSETAYPTEPRSLYLISSCVSSYSTGTVTMTTGSVVVAGAGTTWTSAMEGGCFDFPDDAIGQKKVYLIRKVVSATSLILDEPFYGNPTYSGVSGRSYAITPRALYYGGGKTTSPWGTNASGYVTARLAGEWNNRILVGWTKEHKTAATAPADASAPEYKTRLRWSGIIGSDEGYDSNAAISTSNNQATTGMWAWHLNGFIDLNSRFGNLVAFRQFNGALTVWQEKGMTIVHGTPTYSGLGSIDASTTYADIEINGGFAYEETEHGIFFIDKKRGPMIYTGSGKPEALPMSRFIKNQVRAYDHVGYVNDHVLFLNSAIGSSAFRAWMFHVPTGNWSLWTNVSASFAITHPQRSNDHECVALLENANGVRVISLDSLTRPDGTINDVDGSTIQFSLQSKHFGDPAVELRAEKVSATLRYAGTDPIIYANLYNSTPLGGTPKIVPIVPAGSTSPGNARIKTWSKDVAMDSGPAIRVEILEQGTVSTGAANLEVVRVVVEGTVEGEIATT